MLRVLQLPTAAVITKALLLAFVVLEVVPPMATTYIWLLPAMVVPVLL